MPLRRCARHRVPGGTIVGPDLAEHTRPSSIDGDLLNVQASDPTWATEFRWLEAEVVRRLAEATEPTGFGGEGACFTRILSTRSATNYARVTGRIERP